MVLKVIVWKSSSVFCKSLIVSTLMFSHAATRTSVCRDIQDQSSELVGRVGLEPAELVAWIGDKRGSLCCIYMKYHTDKASPAWHPYKYQVRRYGGQN